LNYPFLERLRRLEINFSQATDSKAAISTYIKTIPVSGDDSELAPTSNAIIAKVGAAARLSQSATPSVALSFIPAELPVASWWLAIMVALPQSSRLFVPGERKDVKPSSASSTSRFGCDTLTLGSLENRRVQDGRNILRTDIHD
jgi:hypothetical protein